MSFPKPITLLLLIAVSSCGLPIPDAGPDWKECGLKRYECFLQKKADGASGVVASKIVATTQAAYLATYHSATIGSCQLVGRAPISIFVIAELVKEKKSFTIPTEGFETCDEIKTPLGWRLPTDWGSEREVCARTCSGWCYTQPQEKPNIITEQVNCCKVQDMTDLEKSRTMCDIQNATADGYFQGSKFPDVRTKIECTKPTDCADGGLCNAGFCQSATCGDGIKNSPGGKPESDIDLGGPCAKAGIGKTCNSGGDCKSAACGMVMGKQVCLGQTGETCTDIAECKDSICSGSPMTPGTCRTPDTGACLIDDECDTKSFCSEMVCKPKPMCKKTGIPGMAGSFCGPPVDQGGCDMLPRCPVNTFCETNDWCETGKVCRNKGTVDAKCGDP